MTATQTTSRAPLAAAPTDPVYFLKLNFGPLGAEWTGDDQKTRRNVVEAIKDGEYRDVVKVLEAREDEGTSRNVTEEIAKDVLAAELEENGGIRSHLMDWLESRLGCGAVAQALREIAA